MPTSLQLGIGINALGSKTPYLNKILSYSPSLYYPLIETSGTIVDDAIGTINGVYVNSPSLSQNQPPFICPYFDGTNKFINFGAITEFKNWVATNFNLFTMSFWFYIDPTVLSSTTLSPLIFIEAAGPAFLRIHKATTANRFQSVYFTQGTGFTYTLNTLTSGWHNYTVSNSYSGTIIRHYMDGIEGANSNLVGNWTATPGSSVVVFAANNNIPTNTHKGYLAHVAFWDDILDPSIIQQLAAT